jgi:hypothetical protein
MDLQRRARDVVESHVLANLGTDEIPPFDTYIVWFAKTLQNWKALVCTDLPDQKYYELTYNGDKDELYVDEYGKLSNTVIEHFQTSFLPRLEVINQTRPVEAGGIHPTHLMQSVSDVPSLCSLCQTCACHDRQGKLVKPCTGNRLKS